MSSATGVLRILSPAQQRASSVGLGCGVRRSVSASCAPQRWLRSEKWVLWFNAIVPCHIRVCWRCRCRPVRWFAPHCTVVSWVVCCLCPLQVLRLLGYSRALTALPLSLQHSVHGKTVTCTCFSAHDLASTHQTRLICTYHVHFPSSSRISTTHSQLEQSASGQFGWHDFTRKVCRMRCFFMALHSPWRTCDGVE